MSGPSTSGPAPAPGATTAGPSALSPQDAWAAIEPHAAPLGGEVVAINQAAGRRLTAPVNAAVALPRETNSAMDGFGVRASDGPHRAAPIIGESRAGVPFQGELPPGAVIRISTGATVPRGVDAVVKVEDALINGDRVDLPQVALGNNIRFAGEDLAIGTQLAPAGMVVRPHHLVALAAAGTGSVRVYRRPRVSIVVTGDEIVQPGAPVGPGQVTDVHGIALPALIGAAGGVVGEILHATDRRTDVDRVLAGLQPCDVVLVTGGLSVGQHDHTRPALAGLGVRLVVERLLMRPGQPTAVGVSDGPRRLWFGLAGNPVSAYAVAALLLAPTLRSLGGSPANPLAGRVARLTAPIQTDSSRWQAFRAIRQGDQVEVLQGQGSHMVAALGAANALVLLPPSGQNLPAGAEVKVLDLDALIDSGLQA